MPLHQEEFRKTRQPDLVLIALKASIPNANDTPPTAGDGDCKTYTPVTRYLSPDSIHNERRESTKSAKKKIQNKSWRAEKHVYHPAGRATTRIDESQLAR